jgi:hypothetical protein
MQNAGQINQFYMYIKHLNICMDGVYKVDIEMRRSFSHIEFEFLHQQGQRLEKGNVEDKIHI